MLRATRRMRDRTQRYVLDRLERKRRTYENRLRTNVVAVVVVLTWHLPVRSYLVMSCFVPLRKPGTMSGLEPDCNERKKR